MKHFSLSEFNLLVKKTLSKNLDYSYWITAEIGEINIASKGHCYLDLVEKNENQINAKLRATIWSYTFSGLHNHFIQVTGNPLQKGMKILLNASFEYHEIYGVSLNIKDIDPNFTLGERERKKQETLKKLEEEGIMDINKSLLLPLVPQRIAIISSSNAAGYGDFMNQFVNNAYGYNAKLQLFQSAMQGNEAVTSLIEALHQIYELEETFDLVIIIRGGGAQTDLDCFDDYDLCAHIAQFPLPIITGIGHERDESIADRVANVSLKTPTAVAEFLLSGMIDFESKITGVFDHISGLAQRRVKSENEKVSHLKHLTLLKSSQIFQQSKYELTRIMNQLETKPDQIVKQKAKEIESIHRLIMAHDPKEVMKKGYFMAKLNGRALKVDSEVQVGDELETIGLKKTLISTVKKISTKL